MGSLILYDQENKCIRLVVLETAFKDEGTRSNDCSAVVDGKYCSAEAVYVHEVINQPNKVDQQRKEGGNGRVHNLEMAWGGRTDERGRPWSTLSMACHVAPSLHASPSGGGGATTSIHRMMGVGLTVRGQATAMVKQSSKPSKRHSIASTPLALQPKYARIKPFKGYM